MTLRRKLAEFGFESNDDYDFALRCWLETVGPAVRCAELAGAVARRKTAFANALGLALDYPNRLYHDFSKVYEPEPIIKIEDPDTGDSKAAKALTPFERILVEACAFSESAKTILVLDQLQLCDFADQLRLFSFLSTREWSPSQAATNAGANVSANPRNLIVVLISTEPLYHSLQKLSFRIWTDAGASVIDFKPGDLGLPAHAVTLLDRFAAVFQALGVAPTLGDYKKILQDCDVRVRSIEQLRVALFGRMENLARERLYRSELDAPLAEVLDAITQLLGVEEVEMGSQSADLA